MQGCFGALLDLRNESVQVHTPYLIRKGVYKFALALKFLDGNTGVEEVVQSASSMRACSAVKPA